MSNKEEDKSQILLEKERDKRTIFRKAHNRENPYAQISKSLLKDRRLSAKAMGIMCYLLGLPDNWEINISELARNFSDGEKSIKSGVRELMLIGYIEKHQERTGGGLFGVAVMLVHEEPTKTPQPLGRVRHSPLDQKRPTVERPAEKSIQQKTKTNRSLKNNKQTVIPVSLNLQPKPLAVVASLLEKVQPWGIAETLLRAWLKKHSAEYVLEKIEYTKSHSKINPSGFLRKAIENNYRKCLFNEIKSELKPPTELVYPSHKDNVVWYAALSDEDKQRCFDQAKYKHPHLEEMLKIEKVDFKSASFLETTWFKMMMQLVGRTV